MSWVIANRARSHTNPNRFCTATWVVCARLLIESNNGLIGVSLLGWSVPCWRCCLVAEISLDIDWKGWVKQCIIQSSNQPFISETEWRIFALPQRRQGIGGTLIKICVTVVICCWLKNNAWLALIHGSLYINIRTQAVSERWLIGTCRAGCFNSIVAVTRL